MITRAAIERLGHQGDGLANGVHIAKTLPGEIVDIDDGRLVRVVSASLERVEAFCAHFATCGGCKFQHWAPDPYAAWKHALVSDALARVGIETLVQPLIDAHGAGRRRVVFHVRQQDDVWQAGFMQVKSHALTAVASCPVLVPQLTASAGIAAAFGPSLGPCDVAITHADNGLDVAVKAERSAVARRMPMLQALFQDQGLCRLSVNGEMLFARETPFVTMGQARVPLPLATFLQATHNGENALAGLVADALAKSRMIADLFCGLGPFALRLAETARVHAVDSEKPAIAALEQAVKNTQGLKPVSTEVRDLFRNPLVPQELNVFDGVVFDPPRAGAESQAKALAKSKVKRIAAVSCDAQTFARDARILIDGGYRLRTVTPIDQFKWTAHVEIVGAFTR